MQQMQIAATQSRVSNRLAYFDLCYMRIKYQYNAWGDGVDKLWQLD